MTISTADKILEFREWVSQACPAMQLLFAEIEDELFAMHRRILDLEEVTQRLKALLHDQGEAADLKHHTVPFSRTSRLVGMPL
jgi:hypothetical protein